MRGGRTESDFDLFAENPQLQNAARRHQAAQEPAGLVRAEERQAAVHEREVRRDLQDAAVRGGDDRVQRDPGAGPA